MFKRLYGYLEYQNIPYPLQFGFKQKGSTNHALIQITESEGILSFHPFIKTQSLWTEK